MLIAHHYHIETSLSLLVVVGILATGVLASMISTRRSGAA